MDTVQFVGSGINSGNVNLDTVGHCGGEIKGFTGGGSNSVVESQPSKLLVAGSIPVSRSRVVAGC